MEKNKIENLFMPSAILASRFSDQDYVNWQKSDFRRVTTFLCYIKWCGDCRVGDGCLYKVVWCLWCRRLMLILRHLLKSTIHKMYVVRLRNLHNYLPMVETDWHN